MFRSLAVVLLFCSGSCVAAEDSLTERAHQSLKLLEDAEQRFQPPPEAWFYETQTALRDEVARVEAAFATMDPNEAAAWKDHLHWELLDGNLQSMRVSLEDLALVRRWLFSNRKGLEDPLFAELRIRMDAHLDAVFTFYHADLQQTFHEQIAQARQQCQALSADPSDVNAVALGRTLGWLERTGQLQDEVEQVRVLLSQPNAQFVVSTEFAQRLLGLFETEVDETIPVRDTEQSPPSGLFQTRRTLQVRGTATSTGSTTLEVAENDEQAEFRLLYRGAVKAFCTADAGPAEIHVTTFGPVMAVKPIFLGAAGLTLGESEVEAQVNTRLGRVTARSNIIRRLARRRATQPASMAFMRSGGRSRTRDMLEENLDQRVEEALDEIRAEISRARTSMDGIQEVFAPVRREGAVPEIHGYRSGPEGIEINIAGQRRNQFGAIVPYQTKSVGGDLQLRLHVSFLNITLETILGGKQLSDEFLMRYAKVLQPTLPLPLMVHARAERWAVTTNKHRPLEFRMPTANRLELVMRIEALDIAERTYAAPAIAVMPYDIVKNDFDEHELVRDGDVKLQTSLPTDARTFLPRAQRRRSGRSRWRNDRRHERH